VTALGDWAVTVTLRAWTAPAGYQDTRFDLIKAVKTALQREGLSFAYPHQVAVESRSWKAPDRARQTSARQARGLPCEGPSAPDDAGRNAPAGKRVSS
jgi:small-conductance mechanosensitive channel